MKCYILNLTTAAIFATSVLLTPTSAEAGTLFEDDFESATANTAIDTSGPWATAAGGSTLRTVRDEGTATPFGSPNQYGELDDDTTGNSIRLQSSNLSAAAGALTTFSFDFLETSAGGGDAIGLGYANSDLNGAGSRLRIFLDNGVITGVTGGTSTYSLDTAYSVHIVFNDSGSAFDTSNEATIADERAHVWIEAIGSGSLVYAGEATATNSDSGSYSVGFRTFTSAQQELLIDNVRLASGKTVGNLFFDDFESYTADANLNTSGPWSNVSVPAENVVRDENTATPFGTPNQYLEYNDDSTSSSPRIQSPDFAGASGAVTTFSFDFNETSGSGGSLIFGYANSGADMNTGGRRLTMNLDDGFITGLTTVADNTYDLDSEYRVYVVFNDTGSAFDYLGGTIDAGSAHVWLEDALGDLTFAGTRDTFNSQTSAYWVGFRSFSSTLQEVLIDNVSLDAGATVPITVPVPAALPAGLAMLGVIASRRRR